MNYKQAIANKHDVIARLLLQAYLFIDTLSMQQYIYLIKLANVQAAGSSYVVEGEGGDSNVNLL